MRNINRWYTCFLLVCVISSSTLLIGGCAYISSYTQRIVGINPIFQEAQQFFEYGQFQKAIDLWEQIPPTDPHYLDAQLGIRSARLQIAQLQKEQISASRQAAQLDAYISQADHFEQQGNLTEALKYYEEARLLAPQNILLYNKIEEIHAILAAARERHGRLGELYLAQGQYEKSKKEWEQLLLVDPSNEQAKQRLADIEVLTATSDSIFYNRGRALLTKGLINAAKAEFEKALQVNPNNERSLTYLSQLRNIPYTRYTVTKGDTLSAVAGKYSGNPSNFQILTDFNVLDVKATLKVGQILKLPHILGFRKILDPQGKDLISELVSLDTKRHIASRNKTKSSRSDNAESSQLLFDQGMTALSEGNYREAITLFRQAYDFDPKNQKAYEYFLLAMNNIKQGITAIDISTERSADQKELQQSGINRADIQKMIAAGMSSQKAGDFKAAIAAFEQAYSLDPGNSQILRYLEAARNELQKLITFHLNAGIKYFNNDALEDAILEWNKVLELDPDNHQAAEYKGRTEKMLEVLASQNK